MKKQRQGSLPWEVSELGFEVSCFDARPQAPNHSLDFLLINNKLSFPRQLITTHFVRGQGKMRTVKLLEEEKNSKKWPRTEKHGRRNHKGHVSGHMAFTGCPDKKQIISDSDWSTIETAHFLPLFPEIYLSRLYNTSVLWKLEPVFHPRWLFLFWIGILFLPILYF